MIELADKLDNLLSNYNMWKINGCDAIATDDVTYEMNKWYYSEFKKLFNNRLNANNKLLVRYNKLIEIYF